MPRTKEANELVKEKKRKLILKTALILFCEEGYQNVPMDKIAKEAKISHGLIYHYYDKKSDILNDLLKESKQKFKDVLISDDFTKYEGSEYFNKFTDFFLSALSLKDEYPYYLALKLAFEFGEDFSSFINTPAYKLVLKNYKLAIEEGKYDDSYINEHIMCYFYLLKSIVKTAIETKNKEILPPKEVILNVFKK